MQSIAWGEFEKVGHRGAHKVRMRRPAVTPAIDVGPHDPARVINVVTIDAGPMIFVLTDDLKAPNRSAISFSAAGYAGRRSSIPCAVEIGFLLSQAHDDRWPAGMTLRQVRCDQVVHSATAAQGHEGSAERTKLLKSIHHWLRPNACFSPKPLAMVMSVASHFHHRSDDLIFDSIVVQLINVRRIGRRECRQ